jgi:hypothetical protein
MRQMRRLIVAGLVTGWPLALPGQAISHQANAGAALRITPVGALPPIVESFGMGVLRSEPGVAVRFGRYSPAGSRLDVNSFGVTADLGAVLLDRAEITAGLTTCAGCSHTIMAGAGFYSELARSAMDRGLLTLGVRPDVGVAHTLDHSAWYWSASLTLPVAYSAAVTRTLRLEPFVQPGLGYGLVTQPNLSSGTVRPMVGGGVGLFATSGMGLHAGAQRVFAPSGTTQFGLGLTWRGPVR